MNSKRIESLIDDNMMKIGFILGLGVGGITDTDKVIIKKAMLYRLKNTKSDLAAYLEGLDDIKFCEQVLNTASYWIEKEFDNSRVNGLRKEKERLSESFYNRLMVRYKARLIKEFRGLSETSTMYRDTISKINIKFIDDAPFDEGDICKYIKNSIVIAKSCHYKIKSGLLLLELMGICNNIQLALAHICYYSYIHESNNFLLELGKKSRSEFLDEWVSRHVSITEKQTINHDSLYKTKDLSSLSQYIDDLINSIDSLAETDTFWDNVKTNIETSRTTLAVISSCKYQIIRTDK
ncbi:hypothetical protein J8A87_20200 [Vibrio parahaemolyticus]|uniref:hypothetical protein n=2 Tax=Vibrio parahaemolyticus TaxID=670 RepID=UPI00387B271B|nr:hypothetical protein [Vibrio parahaemolyticus]MCF9166783.1 hypothetical protein [Vibrio parahaemolyticus]MDG3409926.1 hypothetical protein [Vibrio parahaemolyticus]